MRYTCHVKTKKTKADLLGQKIFEEESPAAPCDWSVESSDEDKARELWKEHVKSDHQHSDDPATNAVVDAVKAGSKTASV